MLGSQILCQFDYRGKKMEGFIKAANTPKPGTIMEIDASVAQQGNRFAWQVYQPGSDGEMPKGPFIVLTEDVYQGKSYADAYAAGDHCFGYVPQAGDILNLLLADVAGTADDHAPNEKLIPKSGTGKLIATTGSPECEVAMVLEQITDPVADTLCYCIWTGR